MCPGVDDYGIVEGRHQGVHLCKPISTAVSNLLTFTSSTNTTTITTINCFYGI